jgi:hypothetical protein
MIARDRTFHHLMAATRKKKAGDRHAKEALAQDKLYPRICRSQSPRSTERRSVIHFSGRFCGVKVNGEWLYRWLYLQDTPRS